MEFKIYNIITKKNICNYLLLLMLFLAGMDFKNLYYYFIFASFAVFLFSRKRFKIDYNIFFLIIISISWFMFAPMNEFTIKNMIKPFSPVLSYIIGLNFLNIYSGNQCKKFVYTITFLSMGPLMHFILNLLANNSYNSYRWQLIDIWTGEVLSATNQASMACLAIAVFTAFLFTNTKFFNKIISLTIIILIFSYNLKLGGRTIFLLIFIAFIVSFIFFICANPNKKNFYKILLFIIILCLILFLGYYLNAFGIQDLIKNSNFFNRFFGSRRENISYDSRLDKKITFLKNLEIGIFGGGKIGNLTGAGYAHDIFLDTYDDAGIFALLAMICFIVGIYNKLFLVLRISTMDFKMKQILISLYFVFIIQFCIEPILQGMPWLFMLFCFFGGMLNSFDITQIKKKVCDV